MRKYPLPLLALLTVSACSQMPPNEGTGNPEVQAPPPAPVMQPAPLPEVALTADLLYRLMAAEMAVQKGQLKVAAAAYLVVARQTQDLRAAKRAAQLAIYARDQVVALEAAELWAALEPESIDAHQSAAALLLSSGRAEEAVEHLEYVLSAGGDTAQSFSMVTNLLNREHDRQRALEIMRRLVEVRHDDPHALYAYGHLAYLFEKHELARHTVERLLTVSPAMSQALVLKANILNKLGEREAALQALDAAVTANPDDNALRLTYARFLVDARQLETARQQFEELAQRLPRNGDVFYALGLLSMQAGDHQQAQNYFEKLLKLGEHTDEAAFALGQLSEMAEDHESALKWYGTVTDGDNLLEARLRTAIIIQRRDGVDAAREYLGALPLEGASAQVRRYLAEVEILRSVDRFEESIAVCDRALESHPDNIDLLYARGMSSEKVGRIDLLERDMRAILAIEPDNAQALNALGYTLADRTDRYDEAYQYIKRALQLAPNDPAVIDSMGWVLYRLGRFEDAARELRRALAMQPDGEIAAHLGEVLWVMGHQQEARDVWNQALEYAPEHAILRQVIHRLTE